MPAGRLMLEGPAVAAQGVELVRIALQEAEQERNQHPLHRVIEAITYRDDCVELTTTDEQLPQRMAEAVRRAHGGELHIDYAKDEPGVRVRWRG
jgi:hypothetical protein